MQCRVCAPCRDQPGREADKRRIGALPVEPGEGIVLAIGIVVAALATPGFIAHHQHRRTARGKQRRHQRPRIGVTIGCDGRIIARTFQPRGWPSK
jgi:hypothetical protein